MPPAGLRRVWRPYDNCPLPSAEEALQVSLRAFPSWFLKVTCGRCGQAQLVNEAHAPWRHVRLSVILARMRHDGCGGRPAYVELLSGIEDISTRPVRRIVLRAG